MLREAIVSPVQFAECSHVATFACADCADRDSDIPVVARASVTSCVTSSVTLPSMVTCHVSRVHSVPGVHCSRGRVRLLTAPVSTLHVELGHFLSAPGVQSPHRTTAPQLGALILISHRWQHWELTAQPSNLGNCPDFVVNCVKIADNWTGTN